MFFFVIFIKCRQPVLPNISKPGTDDFPDLLANNNNKRLTEIIYINKYNLFKTYPPPLMNVYFVVLNVRLNTHKIPLSSKIHVVYIIQLS